MKNSTSKTATAGSKATVVNSSAVSKASTASKNKVQAKPSAADGLRELFVDCLKDIYWAEKALTKALPKMAKNATTESLVLALKEHAQVTKEQVEKVARVFEMIGEKAVAKKCEAMEGLIREGEEIMESTAVGPVRDAGIIAASQKIEHYEIASYGTLRVFAKTLGEEDAASLLEEILSEEKQADALLTEAAYNDINFEAAEEEQQ